MLNLKDGVKLDKLQPQIVLGLISIHAIWDRYTLGFPLTITSGSEGTHKAGSLHYVGRAVDIRTSCLSEPQLKPLVTLFRNALGNDFDVILEVDHIHIEYDPK